MPRASITAKLMQSVRDQFLSARAVYSVTPCSNHETASGTIVVVVPCSASRTNRAARRRVATALKASATSMRTQCVVTMRAFRFLAVSMAHA
jgi:mRNA-degrading endonuclease toxin of MazEF toxin-antitoxin module